MLKMGERGMMTYRAPSHDVRAFFQIDAFAGRVVDPMGAGDALLAYATMSLSATGDCVVASILASMAAAVACEHDGNAPITPDQVLDKIAAVEKRLQYA
jgi:sugar/nucleoside kinase (ribokinase family)